MPDRRGLTDRRRIRGIFHGRYDDGRDECSSRYQKSEHARADRAATSVRHGECQAEEAAVGGRNRGDRREKPDRALNRARVDFRIGGDAARPLYLGFEDERVADLRLPVDRRKGEGEQTRDETAHHAANEERANVSRAVV